ncbi:MAG: peroxiredoxin family protein [Planctomycetes bacterium]|nr:peroxiredoxin family protein [Planctomycetota bacterium]
MRLFALVWSLLAVPALAQEAGDPRGHSRHGSAFDEGPRTAAHEMPGMNPDVHFPAAGLDAAAQRLFDQGVCQLHGFWYFEAERSFRTVALSCPECPMAYWGMAMANVENKPRAAQILAGAVQRAASVPREEQLWIDAFAAYYRIDDAVRAELRSGDAGRVKKATEALAAANDDKARDEQGLAKALIKDLETIVFEFPDDVEAKALLALHIWLAYDWGNGVPITSRAAVDALLDQVFAKIPLHPAHHYRVHLWDQDKKERALKSAAALGASAPGIAHQWHMAGHIYDKQHWHAEAAWQQEASARVDHAQMLRDRVMPFLIHNYGHNQEWLARSLSWTGRGREALEVAKNLAQIPRHPKWNTLDDEDHIAADARSRLASVCEDHEMWSEALALERHGYLDRTDSVRGEVQRLSLLGRALFRLHRFAEAEQVVAETEPLLVRARAARAAALDKAEDEAVAAKKARADIDKVLEDAARKQTDVVRAVLDLQRELRGERLLANGEAKAAVVEFEAVEGFPKTLLADAFVAAGEPERAVDLLEKEVKANAGRAPTLGRLMAARTAAFDATKKDEHAARLRDLMAEAANVGLGLVDGREPDSPLVERVGVGVNIHGIQGVAADAAGFHAAFGSRPELALLGPHHWAPFAAPAFDLPCTDGSRRTLAQQNGRPVLLVFFLGVECLHCMAQLDLLAARSKDLSALGVDVLAIGVDPLPKLREQLAARGEPLPFLLAADPELAAFRAYGCHDDFEGMALHGTILVDGAGAVRWQDIGSQPFERVDWLLAEARRLLALHDRAADPR